MKPENHLDQLIEQHKNGVSDSSLLDSETQELLTAASKLEQLRTMNVPVSFAQKLEQEVRIRARAQAVAEHGQSGKPLPSMSAQVPTHLSWPRQRSLWAAVLCLVALALIVCVGLLVSTRSLAGNSLAGPKPSESPVRLSPTGSIQDQASAAIQQLNASLSNLTSAVNEGSSDSVVSQTLSAVTSWTTTSQQRVAALPSSSAQAIIKQNLATSIVQERQTLTLLLKQVDWSIKLAFTHQLGVLGVSVPEVATAKFRVQDSERVLVTLTGDNFSPEAQFVVDGKLMSNFSQADAHSLVAFLGAVGTIASEYTLGVLNPDGTAAQITVRPPENINETGGTPVPTPTHGDDD